MNARAEQKANIMPRMLGIKELCAYTGLGQSMARDFAKQYAAVVKIGRRVLYDRHVIDQAIDNLEYEATLEGDELAAVPEKVKP